MISKRFCTAFVICVGTAFGPAVAQDQVIPRRVEQPIDWQAVQQAIQTDQSRDSNAINLFRSSVPAGVDSVNVPVLVPGTGPVRASPRFRGQNNAYAAAYLLNAAKLTILGSSIALALPADDSLAASMQAIGDSTEPQFEILEDGTDLSFSRFGASYTLRISCSAPDDERCTKDEFLRSVARSLVTIGGKPQ